MNRGEARRHSHLPAVTAVTFFFSFSYLIFFDKSDESRTFNLDRLSGAVVQSDDKMEKIRFTQVAGRLLFKMGATDSKPLREKKKRW